MNRWGERTGREATFPEDTVERVLVVRCLGGDESAWAELFRVHGPPVKRFLARILGGTDGLDDLVQDVFVTVLTSLERFRGEARLRSWILGVAANTAAHHRRGLARRGRHILLPDQPDFLASLPGTVPDIALGAEARQMLRIIAGALQEVPLEQRSVWMLIEAEGLGTCEVASVLGIPEGTVRSRIFKVRQRMLAALESAGFAREPPGVSGKGERTVITLAGSGRA
jgi:RNA polymerase sigma-70 factor (ECF subfamily)